MMNYKIGFILLIAFSISGCKKDFLDTTSPFGASITEYYSTQDEAVVALTSCYNLLSARVEGLYALGVDGIGIYASDLAISGRVSEFDYSPFESNAQNGSESVLLNIWSQAYAGIYRCNIFLERIEGIEFEDPSLKDRMIAEAKFLRGFFYFDLIRVFGDVPLVLEVLQADEAFVAKDPKEDVYRQVEQDFSDAIQALPLKSEYAPGDMGRITKGAAQAYLMKAYLYQKKYSEAALIGAEVYTSQEYAIADNYLSSFQIDTENGIESILEIQCISDSGQGLGNAHYDLEAFDDTPNPRGYTQPNTEYRNSYGETASGDPDPRRDLNIQFSVISNTLLRSNKYTLPQDPQPANQFDGGNNYVLMRYADFLLLYAEALNETGDNLLALDMINEVRQRPDVMMPLLEGLNQEQTRLAIYDERKWELGLEGHRFFDLVRWGIAGEVIRALDRPFVDGVHELMPIPQSELDLNPNLDQNPGY